MCEKKENSSPAAQLTDEQLDDVAGGCEAKGSTFIMHQSDIGSAFDPNFAVPQGIVFFGNSSIIGNNYVLYNKIDRSKQGGYAWHGFAKSAGPL